DWKNQYFHLTFYDAWPSWQSTYPILLWDLYQYHGDRRVLEEHYAGAKKLVDFLSGAARGRLFADDRLGDTLEPQEGRFSSVRSLHTPPALTNTAYYYESVRTLARIAKVLGRTTDARTYDRLSRNIQDVFNQKFLNP